MSGDRRRPARPGAQPEPTPTLQRNALAPGILAAIVLFLAPGVLIGGPAAMVALFVPAILALIVGWFAIQARQWWWVPVFLAIAVLWNPIVPFGFSGDGWVAAQFGAAVVFLVAGSLIKVPRVEPS